MISEKFGEELRFCRLQKKMTQQDLVETSEVSIGMISDVENGNCMPTLKVAERLVGGVGWKFAAFCERIEFQPQDPAA